MQKSSPDRRATQESTLRLPEWLVQTMARGRELLGQWATQETATAFVATPHTDEDEKDPQFTEFTEDFFTEGDAIPVPAGEVDLRGFEDSLNQSHRMRPSRLTALLTGLSFITGVSMIAAACLGDGEKDPKQLQPADNPDPASESGLSFRYDSLQETVELQLPDDHLITIMDYNQPDEMWDIALPDQASLALGADVSPGKTNRAYRYHVDTVQERLGFSEPANSATADSPTVRWEKNVFARIMDSSRIAPGSNVGYSRFYGNMDVGDRAELTDRLVADWQEYAQVNGWSEDLSELSTHQWMQLIQLEGSQLEYDYRQASTHPEYDASLSDTVWDMPLSELVARGQGVCRDIERINVTSYAIADDLYDLADRGLLYYSFANISDAKHARGMFLVATSQTEMVAIGVDTTNMQGDPLITSGDTAPADTSLWYSQDSSREWLHSAQDATVFYREILQDHGPDLSPTARALATRELAVAEIQLADPFLTRMQETPLRDSELKELTNHLVAAFSSVQAELLLENAGSTTYYLDLPVRQVHLLDGLVLTGRSIDLLKKARSLDTTPLESVGPYQGMALDMFATYMSRTGYTSEDLEEIRRRPERVQFNDEEIARIDQAIQERLQRAKLAVGNTPDPTLP